jgi:hypothetical protein
MAAAPASAAAVLLRLAAEAKARLAVARKAVRSAAREAVPQLASSNRPVTTCKAEPTRLALANMQVAHRQPPACEHSRPLAEPAAVSTSRARSVRTLWPIPAPFVAGLP